ncbi:hypothetical protein B0J11DRAFT_127765 [Dendryphion nanum]|uniref:Uncharacterized protein n=1 Tax=Dendryphion nanum TaxID=256645 RepID=A0A9P9D9G2_9PLEO|nr:hypothetical protein B0J11DRAFT_127765 [Dendryphion nanum]
MSVHAPGEASLFFDLPREIRDLIYNYVNPRRARVRDYYGGGRRLPHFQVNQQMRAEALEALLAHTTLFLTGNPPNNLIHGDKRPEKLKHLGYVLFSASTAFHRIELYDNKHLNAYARSLPALKTLTLDLPRNIPKLYCEKFWNLCCLFQPEPARFGCLFPRYAITLLLRGIVQEVRLVFPATLSTHSAMPTAGIERVLVVPKIPDLGRLVGFECTWDFERLPQLLQVFGQHCFGSKHEWSWKCCSTPPRKSLVEVELDREMTSLTVVLVLE